LAEYQIIKIISKISFSNHAQKSSRKILELQDFKDVLEEEEEEEEEKLFLRSLIQYK